MFKPFLNAFALLCLSPLAIAEQQQPNILFLLADDLSYEAIGALGQVDIDTPNIDRLVEHGAVFTHTYNMGAYNGAVCIASRAMLNTGRFLWDVHRIDTPEQMQDVADAGQFWSQRMKRLGYRTYLTGKWHVKVPPGQVFDVTADIRDGMPQQTDAGYNRPLDPEDYAAGWKPWETKYGGFWEGGKHWSEVVADHGESFLRQAASEEKPFFMYLAFNAPHDPHQSPKEYIDRYPLERIKLPENYQPVYPYQDDIGCGNGLRDERLAPFPRTEYSIKVQRQEYFAQISHMDAQIGRIFQALETSGKKDNTYIVFAADNGLAEGHHGFMGKQNMYDHSVRVPLIVVGPGIPENTKIDAPVYLQDILPTTLQWAGDSSRKSIAFESLLPLLNKEHARSNPVIYGAYKGFQRMICKDEWKLIVYPTIQQYRLFNMADDPLEMNDLSGNPEYAGTIKELYSELVRQSASLNDPLDYKDPLTSWTDYENSRKNNPQKQKK